ncbi:MAG: TatD family hydrolase [Flavisolibacter sp.]
MQLIDTHAHIYLKEFEPDRLEILQRAKQNFVGTILMPAIDSATHKELILLSKNNDACKAMMGLHPCSVSEDYMVELEIVQRYLNEGNFIAIGEIGLDYYWDKKFMKEQIMAFRKQIELALERNLPISVHSRNATAECIEVVREYKDLRGVFHCFSGTYEQGMDLVQIGFYLGIGGVVTFKNAGLDKIIEKLPLTQMVLETDAPYLAPVPFRGKRNEPSYISNIISRLAIVFGASEERIASITTNNAKALFNL